MSEPTAARRRLLTTRERASSILLAASAVFAERGFAGSTVDEIAARAGVSKLIVYRHFNSKQELYLAILDQIRDRLADVQPPSSAPTVTDSRGAIAAAIATLAAEFAVAREYPDGYRLLHRHAAHEPEFAGYVAGVTAASQANAEALLAGVPDPTVRVWMGRLISRTVNEAFLDWLDVGDPNRDDEMVRRVVHVLGSMVGAVLTEPTPGRPAPSGADHA